MHEVRRRYGAIGLNQQTAVRVNLASILPVVVGAMLCWKLWRRYNFEGTLYLADDAFYYLIIAKNIATHGLSTFDQQTVTNGYHPLWMVVLVLQQLLLGGSIYTTIAVEVVCVSSALYFMLRLFENKDSPLLILFGAVYVVIVWPMVGQGMEVPLFLLCYSIFLQVAASSLRTGGNALALGFVGALCIGARLDTAFFVLPAVLLASRSLRDGAKAVAVIAGIGLLYGTASLWVFGAAIPVSASVKSLGGLQLNTALVTQIEGFWRGSNAVLDALRFFNSFIGRPLVFLLLAILLILFTRMSALSRLLCASYVLGMILFSSKLLFGSSWQLWSWYGFPSVLGLLAVCHAVAPRYDGMAALQSRPGRVGTLAAAVALMALWITQLSRVEQSEQLARDAIAQLAPILRGERIAMGDRAGSFAFYYPGPVTQLEGLVGDATYFRALAEGKDILPILCSRKVRFIVAYQKDLGDYTSAEIQILRPRLTSFRSVPIRVMRGDEVGHFHDLGKYDNSALDEGDNHIYAWRLSQCDRQPGL